MINNKAMELIGKAFYGNYKVGDIVLANVTDDNEDKKIVIKAPIVDTYGEQYVLDYNLESYYVDEEDIISIAPNENNKRFYPDDKLFFKSKDGQELIVNFRGYTNFTAMDKAIVVMPNGMQMQVDTSQLSRNNTNEIVPQEILIEKSNDMSNENIDITENDVDILESQPIQEQQVNSTWMINDNWYEQHPDKVLGQSYEASGKFGKVTKYRGDIDVLELIEVDLSFIGADKVLIDPLASVSYDMNASAEILKPEVAQHIINVIEDANASFREVKLVTDISGSKTKEKVRKSSKIGFTKLVPYVVDETIPLNSFSDTFNNLNDNISLEEVEVFTWYKSSIGQPLSKYYVTLFDKNRFSESENLRETFIYTVPESKVNDWVNDGLLRISIG